MTGSWANFDPPDDPGEVDWGEDDVVIVVDDAPLELGAWHEPDPDGDGFCRTCWALVVHEYAGAEVDLERWPTARPMCWPWEVERDDASAEGPA